MTQHRHEGARHEARGHLCNLRDHVCWYGRAYRTGMHPWQRNSAFYLGGIAAGFLPWALLFGINTVSSRGDIAVNVAIAGYCLTLAVAIVVVFNIQYPLTAYWR